MESQTESKQVIAARKRWAKIPISKRSKRMSLVAKKGWETKSPEERKARSLLMVKALKLKAKNKNLSKS